MGKGDVEYQQHLWHQLQARGLYFIPQTFLLRKMDQSESRGSCTQMEWMVYIKQVNTGSARGELWWILWHLVQTPPLGPRHSSPQLAEVLAIDGSWLIPPEELLSDGRNCFSKGYAQSRGEAHTPWLAKVETQKSSPLPLIWDSSAGPSQPPSS